MMFKIQKKTEDKIFKMAYIILFLVLAFAMTFWIVFSIALEPFKPIANLHYKESEWIKINDAKLYAYYSSGLVAPNDQINLVLNVTNKQSLNIEIIPYFETYVGGKLIESSIGNYVIWGHDNTGKLELIYYAKSEGLNVLAVPLKISLSNGTFLTFQNASTSFNVLSLDDKLSINQNYILIVSVIASISLVGILSWQVILLKRQVSHGERTSKIAVGPFISPREMTVEIFGPRVGFSNVGSGSAKEIHLHLSDAETGDDLDTFDLFAMRASPEEDRPSGVNPIDHPRVLIQGTYQNVIDETKIIQVIYDHTTRTTENIEDL